MRGFERFACVRGESPARVTRAPGVDTVVVIGGVVDLESAVSGVLGGFTMVTVADRSTIHFTAQAARTRASRRISAGPWARVGLKPLLPATGPCR